MLGASYPVLFRDTVESIAQRGWRRVILLGDDLVDGPYTLKACLAQAGIVVLSPGPKDRAWLQGLAHESTQGEGRERLLGQLRALLNEGMEHGVEALVATDATLGSWARETLPGVPLFEVEGD